MAAGGIVPAIVALLVFLGATGTTAFQAYRHRTWFLWSLILSGILFVLAFALRAAYGSSDEIGLDTPLLIVAIIPQALAAFFLQHAVFTLFLRLVWWTAPSPSTLTRQTLWFAPRYAFRWMSGTLFLLAVVQCVPIYIFIWAGLVAQTIVLAVFLAFVGRFGSVSKCWDGLVQGERMPGAWRKKGLAAVGSMGGLLTLRSILIWVMIIFGETDNFITVYLFDALPLLVCFILFGCLHPGTYMPADFTRFRMDKDSVMQTKMADARVAELTRDAYLAANSSTTTRKSDSPC